MILLTALKKIREAKHITQLQLGTKLGVTANAISQWESGVRKPNIVLLKKLALALECTTDDLLELTNHD